MLILRFRLLPSLSTVIKFVTFIKTVISYLVEEEQEKEPEDDLENEQNSGQELLTKLNDGRYNYNVQSIIPKNALLGVILT